MFTHERLRPKKKAKKQDLSTITLGYLHSKGKSMKVKHMKRIRILFDTGCGATLINHSMVTKLSQKQEKPCNWNTKAGSFQTTKTCKIKFTLPAFHKHRNISWKAFVDETAHHTMQKPTQFHIPKNRNLGRKLTGYANKVS